MITQKVLDVFMFIPSLIIDLVPEFTTSIPENVFDGVNTVLYGIGYVLPMTALAPIFIISFAVDNFRVVIALIVRIKSFIPTMGD